MKLSSSKTGRTPTDKRSPRPQGNSAFSISLSAAMLIQRSPMRGYLTVNQTSASKTRQFNQVPMILEAGTRLTGIEYSSRGCT
ncbi:hypothetical protein K0M31_018626 [Melipona bicolor]|uniref:Uncharacterized protein n=1 Tax=Melipona bicolor TaxID=60889 RepID=A0AA40KRU2_9HYME|nr:hypothetical protein K0M31_018626 [Melipona bicolor]